MVALQDPVATAHTLLHNSPLTPIPTILSSLPPPPLSAIPHITDTSARPGHWVRYTGMVQDVWDTELFVASCHDGKSGLLVENAAATDSPKAKLAERLPVYLVSVPGETEWVRDINNPNPLASTTATPASTTRPKRPRDTSPEQGHRTVQPMDTMDTVSASLPPSSDKRHRLQKANTGSSPTCMGLNVPVPTQAGASAIVAKLYDPSARDLRINTMVEAVGILQDPLQLSPDPSNPHCFAMELAARNPNNVKRLHVVQWRQLSPMEIHPLTRGIAKADLPGARKELLGVATVMRDLLLGYLAVPLFGDLLAAEYLLMCLLSRPSRVASSTVLGKLSLNLILPSTSAPDAAANLIAAISHICPSVVELNVCIAALNSMEVYPRKDYNLNRLKAAPLQLSPGACLIANETQLSDGRLAERGVKNVRALTAVAQRCATPIDFQYYEGEIVVDCCTVLVSKAGKSIIPADVIVRVKPQASVELQQWRAYDAEALRKMRLALPLLAEDGKFDITEQATRDVEQAYVEARKNGRAKDGQDTLQKWLAVARCSARSFGEGILDQERWQYALQLENRREQQAAK